MTKATGHISAWAIALALLVVPAALADTFCWKNSNGRGVGTIPTNCGGKENDAGLCYTKCPANYKGVGPVCWQNCPSGYSDFGVGCSKPAPYGRGAGYPWKFGDGLNDNGMFSRCRSANPQGCEKNGAVVYPKCKAGYHQVGCCICSPDCPGGLIDSGASCTKKSQGRGAGTIPVACDGGKQYDAGLCYSQCSTGYYGIGPVCWQNCPPSFPSACGAGCATTKDMCSSEVRGQVMSVLEVAANVATTVSTFGAGTAAKAAAETAGKAAIKAAVKKSATQVTKEAAKKVIQNSMVRSGTATLAMNQADQLAAVASGSDDYELSSLDPTGIMAAVNSYNHDKCPTN